MLDSLSQLHLSKTPIIHVEPIQAVHGATGAALAGTDVIGFSYDIFDARYGEPGASRERLFDLGPAVDSDGYEKPQFVRKEWHREGEVEVNKGESAKTLSTSFSASAKVEGSYGAFSGSISASYDTQSTRTESSYFIQQRDHYVRYRLKLDLPGPARAQLLDHARADIDNPGLSPADLFDKYGTHYLGDILVGARATYSSATNSFAFNSSSEISVAAEASYKGLIGKLSGEAKAKYKQAMETFSKNSVIKVMTRGGDEKYAHKIANGSYDEWIDSIGDNNIVMVGYGETGLTPIWTLAEGARAKELADAFPNYAASKPGIADPDMYPVFGFVETVKGQNNWRFSLEKSAHPKMRRANPIYLAFKEPRDGTLPVLGKAGPSNTERLMQLEKGSADLELRFHAYAPNHAGIEPIIEYSHKFGSTTAYYYDTKPSHRGTGPWTVVGNAFGALLVPEGGYI